MAGSGATFPGSAPGRPFFHTHTGCEKYRMRKRELTLTGRIVWRFQRDCIRHDIDWTATVIQKSSNHHI
jgi:hypothetical protein